jgi:hypothetical protein
MSFTSTTQELFLNQLVKWFTDESGFRFIRAYPNAAPPRGGDMYGTVLFMSAIPIGRPEKIHEPSGNLEPDPLQIRETIRTMHKTKASIQIYQSYDDDKTFDTADELRLKLHTSNAHELFAVNGMGFVEASTVRDFYEERDGGSEKRSQFDCCFNITTSVTTLIDNIEGIETEAYRNRNGASPELINTTLTERN